jgi:hypothetical protein
MRVLLPAARTMAANGRVGELDGIGALYPHDRAPFLLKSIAKMSEGGEFCNFY